VIENGFTRGFEGTRSLCGLILEKTKRLEASKSEQEGLAFMNSMKVLELWNLITMEPSAAALVQTLSGLVNHGFHKAFTAEGILSWVNNNDVTATLIFNVKI